MKHFTDYTTDSSNSLPAEAVPLACGFPSDAGPSDFRLRHGKSVAAQEETCCDGAEGDAVQHPYTDPYLTLIPVLGGERETWEN